MADTLPKTPELDRLAEGVREAGLTAVESYEKSGWGVAELQGRVAKATPVEWLSTLLDAQADFTRTLVSAQASAARGLLK